MAHPIISTIHTGKNTFLYILPRRMRQFWFLYGRGLNKTQNITGDPRKAENAIVVISGVIRLTQVRGVSGHVPNY